MHTQTRYGWTSPQVLVGIFAMAAIVAASNYLVTTPVKTILGVDMDALTGLNFSGHIQWAALIYPISFLVTDLMNRAYGAESARRVIFIGFILGVILSVIGSISFVRSLPDMANVGTMELLSSKAFWLDAGRIPIASGTAFLVAQLLDISVFNRLREGTWWKAPLISSVIAGAIDSLIFWVMAFGGTGDTIFPGGWVNFGVADWIVKLSITLAMLIPFRAMTWKLRAA